MMPAVTAVIATLGRPSLGPAVQTILDQTWPVAEIVVVVDSRTDAHPSVSLPRDDRIVVLNAAPGSGAARCRQLGIEAASGSVIALLDDDDEWYRDKLERQLAVIGEDFGPNWILSSRVVALGPNGRRRTWPRRLIKPGQSVTEYLFRADDIGVGGAVLQTSTMVFPTELARIVPWDVHGRTIHDEPTWLIEVQRRLPDVRLAQLPEVLSTYHVGSESTSRAAEDRSVDYIDWGLRNLSEEPPRILGDYLCTSPVSAAVAAGSLAGVGRAVSAAVRYGRPGPQALAYAAINAVRIIARRLGSAVAR